MERFLVIIREEFKFRQAMTAEESARSIQTMVNWIEALAESGNYVNSEPLMDKGKYISRDYVLSDGPFIESKEAISGYMMMQAENLEQASAIMQTCPLMLNDRAIIELRPIGKGTCK